MRHGWAEVAGGRAPPGDADTGPPLPDGSGHGYGLGVEVDTEAGYRRVGHQGDCPGYCSYAYGCTESGAGVAALGNGPWREPASPASAWAVVDHGLALLRAAAAGLEAPPDPPAAAPDPPASAPATAPAAGELPGGLAPLVGTYAAWNRWTPELRVSPDAAGAGLGDDPASPERVRFTTLVEGRPMQLVVSGWPFDRVD